MSRVQLHVYDLSSGLAAQFSPMLLGKRIEAIYHTGVVAYGREYYFGGGIQSAAPGSTVYGRPIRVVDMGETGVARDVFEDYLRGIRARFTPQRYRVLEWNCNNFSHEVCQFLLGDGARFPREILELPREAMNSPLGPMIRPFLESMQERILEADLGGAGGSGATAAAAAATSTEASSSSSSSNLKSTAPQRQASGATPCVFDEAVATDNDGVANVAQRVRDAAAVLMRSQSAGDDGALASACATIHRATAQSGEVEAGEARDARAHAHHDTNKDRHHDDKDDDGGGGVVVGNAAASSSCLSSSSSSLSSSLSSSKLATQIYAFDVLRWCCRTQSDARLRARAAGQAGEHLFPPPPPPSSSSPSSATHARVQLMRVRAIANFAASEKSAVALLHGNEHGEAALDLLFGCVQRAAAAGCTPPAAAVAANGASGEYAPRGDGREAGNEKDDCAECDARTAGRVPDAVGVNKTRTVVATGIAAAMALHNLALAAVSSQSDLVDEEAFLIRVLWELGAERPGSSDGGRGAGEGGGGEECRSETSRAITSTALICQCPASVARVLCDTLYRLLHALPEAAAEMAGSVDLRDKIAALVTACRHSRDNDEQDGTAALLAAAQRVLTLLQ